MFHLCFGRWRKGKHTVLRRCLVVLLFVCLPNFASVSLECLRLKSGALNEQSKACPLSICLNGQSRRMTLEKIP